MRATRIARCRIQQPCAESFFDCGWRKSGACELKKTEDTWCTTPRHYDAELDTARRVFKGQCNRRRCTYFCGTPTATGTSCTLTATTTARGTGTTTGSTTIATATTCLRFSQLSSFLSCSGRGVLFLQLPLPATEHFTHIIQLS